MGTVFLRGGSGCELVLKKSDNSGRLVRKISGGSFYNDRLKAQWKKHLNWSRGIFKVPEVFGSGYVDGRFYYDMEYVPSLTLAEALDRDQVNVNKISDFFETFFQYQLALRKPNARMGQLYGSKIRSVKRRLKGHLGRTAFDKLDLAFRALEQSEWLNFETVTHGDFTLNNLLLSGDGSIFLIDFLDEFSSNIVADVAALYQDFKVHWSYGACGPRLIETQIKLKVLERNVREIFSSVWGGEDFDRVVYSALSLNLLRILQYQYQDGELSSRLIEAILKISEGPSSLYGVS